MARNREKSSHYDPWYAKIAFGLFLRDASFPIIRTPNADGTEAAFFLFFSAFGFFFSRLLLNWPFAILSSLRLRAAF